LELLTNNSSVGVSNLILIYL